MTEYRIACNATRRDDYMTADREFGDVYLGAHTDGAFAASIYANPNDARTFTRGILALADEIDGGEAEEPADTRPKVGDYVEITRDRTWTSEDVGKRGRIVQIDRSGSLQYYVLLDDAERGTIWFMDVRKVDETDDTTAPASTSRARYVEEAKRLWAGVPHTAADVVSLAEFLANE